MKRELKGVMLCVIIYNVTHLTKLIPMKRELKVRIKATANFLILTTHKANPYEKGTES